LCIGIYCEDSIIEVNAQNSPIMFHKAVEGKLRAIKELPFQVEDFQSGLKYPGFLLNPNEYAFKDWFWLYSMIEIRGYIMVY
jgi:hypothetical protein